jgi:hypothetical protein
MPLPLQPCPLFCISSIVLDCYRSVLFSGTIHTYGWYIIHMLYWCIRHRVSLLIDCVSLAGGHDRKNG